MNILGVIPARFASSRFPGKPLVDIGGQSMIWRVYQQACKAEMLHSVVVATDEARIFEHVEALGGKVVMTRADHPSGTDRVVEVAGMMKEKVD
ncbi:MAG: 3-deoxy-manno-octulosonate cytidylyltransferase, partial [Bacteroidota bacterium]